jgi:hypothetical protein
VLLAQQPQSEHLVVLADQDLLAQRAKSLGLPWRSLSFNPANRRAAL